MGRDVGAWAYNEDLGGEVHITLVNLAGSTIAELVAAPSETVASLKRRIHDQRPTDAPRWQRLILGDRELNDTEVTCALTGDCDVVLNFIVVVQPWDLLGNSDVAAEAALSISAMGAGAAPHIAQLFQDTDGVAVPPDVAADTLHSLARKHLADPTYGKPERPCTAALRTALLPHAMDMLCSENLPSHRQDRLGRIFVWLETAQRDGSWCRPGREPVERGGPAVVPRLVAWLGLLPRPVPLGLCWRVEQLRKHSDSPRVRLAAKMALDDKGHSCIARVEELASLRNALARDALLFTDEERKALEMQRTEVSKRLQSLKDCAEDRRVRYAASRALGGR